MADIQLSIAVDHVDHVRDFVDGRIRASGIEVVFCDVGSSQARFRMRNFLEFDVSEAAFGGHVSAVSRGTQKYTAIPVFPSRIFRHSSFYVRERGSVKTPVDLKGKRIGLPAWSQTSCIFAKGLMAHEWGVDLASVEWVQAAVYEPGREEHARVDIPNGVRCRPEPQKSLTGMLASGEIDCAMTAIPPKNFGDGVVRLFPDYRPVEEEYYRKTGIFPIMHVMAVRNDVLERHPWVALALYTAFDQAKNRSLARLRDPKHSAYPIPWNHDDVRRLTELFGEDLWPYGVKANHTTLDAFLQYAFEQGVCQQRLKPEELFPREVQVSRRT